MTRIVAGAAGGRRLAVPPKGTRPTADRVREALFSALDADGVLGGARVLDLYAGSGALGFEALSRGAALATLVEADRTAVSVLRRNAATVALPGVDIRASRVDRMLAAANRTPYDLVFADPPYAVDDDELAAVLTELAAGWLAPDATVVVERSTRSGDPRWPSALVPDRSRRYGETTLHWAAFAGQRHS
ncbi:16S rRNA (guanine(966)-N(2))-methyltransferase RsmD [Actinokineospora auranticolor]|uniref:16S rRNA (Guanine966-N2)-methyltransferase n=1 Tax=Actinokineospora auranticolor TaxID=155976 RepID=A0A2S6GGT4_9PSEU|nr:16S rRNA (guanine(966)-N(2))-methyltransferase RsmD [Actinokineospora auranticolor]PPK64356.1 16S rRNA (guanine966-N2)-methyltransferase [Actinokineospora auranticolor]